MHGTCGSPSAPVARWRGFRPELNVEFDIRINMTRHAGGPVMNQSRHLAVLDGWRGLSILFVLAAHLLPLGPRTLQFNYSIGILGMVVFFNLSGFLITSFLLQDQRIGAFLIKRFCRVLPLAWLYLALALSMSAAPLSTWLSHFLFYTNFPPNDLLPMTEHLWSLCMEVQFYVGVALLVILFRARGLLLLPLLAVMFTVLRAANGVMASSVSYYRIDEILAGCALALAYHGRFGIRFREWLTHIPQWWLMVLLVLSSMPQGGWLNYLRPYLAALLIGATIVRPGTGLARLLGWRFFLFCAAISYALYVIHPILTFTWLASGTPVMKYVKRPLFLAVLFALAYVSTRYYESWFISLGRILARRVGPRPTGPLITDTSQSMLKTTDPLSPK
jgi:peptidoglycan/LPS O-acetylase OafA/YrhL